MEQPTKIDFSFVIQKIIMHPDMVLPNVGDTYRGIPVVRDETMPMYQVRMVCGDRIIVLTMKTDIDISTPGTIKLRATPQMELLGMPIIESDSVPSPNGIKFGRPLI